MSEKMRGVVLTGNRQLEVREFDIPEPGYGEVLIKVKASAICGSDLHHYRRTPTEGEILYISGHEPAGVVAKLGPGVTTLEVGQRVCCYHYHICGKCNFCRQGLSQHCTVDKRGLGNPRLPGTDADYFVIDAANAFPMPDSMTFTDGAFCSCIGGTAFRALKKLEITTSKTLLVTGLGPVGLTAAIFGKAMGAKLIIGTDPNPDRREIAKQHGVDVVLDGLEGTADEIIKITNGGVDCAIETSGSVAAQVCLMDSLAHFGKASFVGLPGLYDTGAGVKLDRPFIFKEVTLMGSFVVSLPEFGEMIEFMHEKDIHFDSLVTHRFKLEEAEEAFKIFDSGKTGKVIFDLE